MSSGGAILRSRSRSRRHRSSSRKGKKRSSNKKSKKERHDRDRGLPHFAPAGGPMHPGGFYGAPFGYSPPPGMPWAPPPHMVSSYSYGAMSMSFAPRSNMADDGVSMQVSEKFLMRNDYCQTFLDTGMRPQNFIRDLDYANRYSEYPKIERLMILKDEILAKRATPAMSLKADLKTLDLNSLGTKFDVVLIDPPWEEYQTRVCGMYVPGEDLEPWTMDELKNLKVGEAADAQSFCFIWCGQTHLEHGRELLKRWGFRRVEDIVWVKTNRNAEVDERGKVKQGSVMYGDSSILQRTKEHCLLGVKGTLKRSEDTHFIHANCDTDLIMQEGMEFGSTEKPKEIYETVEHFCLGRRRLELFGLDRNMRDGWLTVGRGLTFSNWSKEQYLSWFEGEGQYPHTQGHIGGRLLGSIAEIDVLRPKSPVRPGREKRAAPASSQDEDRPLPEDLGELAPKFGKEADEDDKLPNPVQPGEYKFK